jgi:hypothetical protein
MLYLADLRELQTDLNSLIVLGQEFTANPWALPPIFNDMCNCDFCLQEDKRQVGASGEMMTAEEGERGRGVEVVGGEW